MFAVFHSLAVLAHQDYRSLDRGQTGKDQIEENVRIRIERGGDKDHAVEHHPANERHEKEDDERPAATERGDVVGQSLTEGYRLVEIILHTAADMDSLRDGMQDAALLLGD